MTTEPDTWLIYLNPAECEELLHGAEIGRLGVVSDGRPLVFPVCHVFVDGVVAVPTNEGTKLHSALAWPYVSFEVDGVDDDGMSGWSVMVAGRAEEVEDPAEQERLAAQRDVPWRTGASLRWIRIVPSEISGRRILGQFHRRPPEPA